MQDAAVPIDMSVGGKRVWLVSFVLPGREETLRVQHGTHSDTDVKCALFRKDVRVKLQDDWLHSV
jgi:hypothetical protein